MRDGDVARSCELCDRNTDGGVGVLTIFEHLIIHGSDAFAPFICLSAMLVRIVVGRHLLAAEKTGVGDFQPNKDAAGMKRVCARARGGFLGSGNRWYA